MVMGLIKIEYKRFATFLIYLFGLMYANAQKVTINGLKYYLIPETQEAIIDNNNTWAGELDIPSKVSYNEDVFTVSGMGSLAFSNCTELTKVRIPNTLVNIIHSVFTDDPQIVGEAPSECMNPFEGCTALESIEVDRDNPSMKSVGGVLFNKDGTGLYCYPAGIKAEAYVVPDGVTWIGLSAFENNEYIVLLKLPSTIENIYASAFNGCKKLENVTLPEKLTYLEAYMFKNCSSLKSINIPFGVKYLGEQVFFGCSSLNIIDLPESVSFVGSISFMNCMLDALVIRGVLDSQSVNRDLFAGMNESANVYVLASEIDRYKDLYAGTVLPIEKYTTDIPVTPFFSGNPSATFDLQGRRLSAAPQKGVYIQDGKKKLVR